MDSDLHKLGLRLKFFYSLGGLVLGGGCIVGGITLFLSGVVGSTTWTFSALGIAESNFTDAAPGTILFCVGLFFVIFTRFKVVATQEIEFQNLPPGTTNVNGSPLKVHFGADGGAMADPHPAQHLPPGTMNANGSPLKVHSGTDGGAMADPNSN